MTRALGLTSVNAKTVPSVVETVEIMNSHSHGPVLPMLQLLHKANALARVRANLHTLASI